MSLFNDASLITTPNGVKAGKLFSVKPFDGSGDFTWVRNTNATRVNENGLIETVGANVPRLDYSNGGCPCILVEPQRTNLLLRSEEFNNASWIKDGTVTPNSITAPDGNATADLWTTAVANNVIFQNVTVTPLTMYTFSFWVRRGTMTDMSYFIFNNTAGAVIIPTTSYFAQTSSTSWNRIIVSFTTPASCVSVRVYPKFGNSGIAVGTAYFWGAQLEAGSNATSYIPTVASAVTRNADVCSKTGIADLIGQTEGTLFIEMASLTNNVISNYFSISDGTFANRASILFTTGTNFIRSFLRVNSISQFDRTAIGLNITEMNKIAFAYKQNDFAMYVNGVLIQQSNTGNTFNPNTLSIVSFSEIGAAGGQLNARVKQSALFKTRLSNSELQQLTAL